MSEDLQSRLLSYKTTLVPIDEENQLEDDVPGTSCISCFNENKTIQLPCGHNICKICVCKLEKKQCPYCKHKFELIHQEHQNSNANENKYIYINCGCIVFLLGFIIYEIFIIN